MWRDGVVVLCCRVCVVMMMNVVAVLGLNSSCLWLTPPHGGGDVSRLPVYEQAGPYDEYNGCLHVVCVKMGRPFFLLPVSL